MARFRRRFRRTSLLPRRRTTWMYAQNDVTAGAGLNVEDLLAPYRTAAGITLNLPKLTIGRIIIKISVRLDIGVAPTTTTDGFIVGFYVDAQPVNTDPLVNPYNASWMWRESVYAGEEQANTIVSGATNDVLIVKKFDIRSRRKIVNDFDTLSMAIKALPGSTLTQYSYDAQILVFV